MTDTITGSEFKSSDAGRGRCRAVRRLLHIAASPRGAASESLQIAETFLDAYREMHPGNAIETWDLWDGSLPAFGPAAAAAKMAIFTGDTPKARTRPRGKPRTERLCGSIRPSICCSAFRCGTQGSPTSSSS
ncbi:MAG: NAD(P)H-dependent oxidoreductase [Solirubrobacteraceae bacterium]